MAAKRSKRVEVERENGIFGFLVPDCNTSQRIPRTYRGEHAPEKWRVVEGPGSQSNVIICWNCANDPQMRAIRRKGGGPR